MRKSVPWQHILQGVVLNQSTFGTEYKVPNLGRVWVGISDIKDASARGDDLLCNLVTLPDEPEEDRIWAIVGFQQTVMDDMDSGWINDSLKKTSSRKDFFQSD
jgi:hypothetical protein